MPVKNFPGPYELRLFYSTTPSGLPTFQHVAKYNVRMVLPVVPGTLFSALSVLKKDGTNQSLSTAVDTWVTLFRAALSNAANNTVDYAELWYYEPGTFNASFISVYSIALAGSNAGTASPATEAIITYRTLEGGIMRQHFEEWASGIGGPPDTPPFAVASFEAIRAYVESTACIFIGRDTSLPFATIALYPGQNEALFKKRYRP